MLIREHLEQCTEQSNDLHQKLRSLTAEWRNLKSKEEVLAMRTVKDCTSKSIVIDGAMKEDALSAMFAMNGRSIEQDQNPCNKIQYSSISSPKVMLDKFESPLEEGDQSDSHMNQHLKSTNVQHSNGNISQNRSPSSASITDNGKTADTNFVPKKVVEDVSTKKINLAPAETINNFEHTEHMPIKADDDCLDNKNILNGEDNGSLLSKEESIIANSLFSDNDGTNFEEYTAVIPNNHGVKMSLQNSVSFCQSSTLQGNALNISFSTFDGDNCNLEMSYLRKEIAQLQESIASVESQVVMTSLRRELLGRDSLDQLYWIIGRPGKRPWLLVDGTILTAKKLELEQKNFQGLGSNGSDMKRNAPSALLKSCFISCYDMRATTSSSCPMLLFESESEMQKLVGWLRDSDFKERDLKGCIYLWKKLNILPENYCASRESPITSYKSSICEEYAAPLLLNTHAANILEKKYGFFLNIEVNEIHKKHGKKAKVGYEDRLYRCECLEPVWSARNHCTSCHQTFSTLQEFEGHIDEKCISSIPGSDESKEYEDPAKIKNVRCEAAREKWHYDSSDNAHLAKIGKVGNSLNLFNFLRKKGPYELDEIRKTFITNNSNKELVKEIGLIGSKGSPSLIPGYSLLFLEDTFVCDRHIISKDVMNDQISFQVENTHIDIAHRDIEKMALSTSGVHHNGDASDQDVHVLRNEGPEYDYTKAQRVLSSSFGKSESCKCSQSFTISEPSLRPLFGKKFQVVKRLKIILLDIDAALPAEAIKPSKASSSRRCAWRSFVKSAESLFELVQATIVLEGMIKTDSLKNGWWYWSSLTAAARTATISSLALRVYSLDASIIYVKDIPEILDLQIPRPINRAGRKRKDLEGS